MCRQTSRLLILTLLTWIPWLGVAAIAEAQNYRFQVEEMKLQAYVQRNGSIHLVYDITFQNAPGAKMIDIVDIGLPKKGYHSYTGSVLDNDVRKIQPSEYIPIGVEMHLGPYSIPGGRRSTVHFECDVPEMIYQDSTDKEYASVQIKPTWYDSQFQYGQTHLMVAIHMPPGVPASSLRYQNERQRYAQLVEYGEGEEKHAVAIWESEQMTLSSANPKFSVSFPKSAVDKVITRTLLDLLNDKISANPQLQFFSGSMLVGMFAFLFFRFSHGTGCVVFVMLLVGLLILLVAMPLAHLLAWPTLGTLIGVNEWAIRKRQKEFSYLPAMATVEGGGIKRGLTAPEAAVLLELPLGKVLAMVIYGLLKKDAVQLVKEDPLTVSVTPDFAISRKKRRRLAGSNGVVIHEYEHAFIEALMRHKGPVEKCDLNKAMGEFVKSVANRMQGFDLQATREYYQTIVKRAWAEAGVMGEVEQRTETIDRNFEWMMMDPTWRDLFEAWRMRGYTYRPRWDRPRRTTYGGPVHIPTVPGGRLPGGKGGSAGGGASTGGGGGSHQDISFGEIAGGFVGWLENSAARFTDSIDPTAMGMQLPKGILDLSGVDRVTSDVFEALAKSAASGGGGRGGGGGGCACACAGCACACACAGGGR